MDDAGGGGGGGERGGRVDIVFLFSYVCMWIGGYECTSFCTNVCTMYVRDPVRLRLRHLYQVEFCSFIVRYPTVGASMYCGHISNSCFLFVCFFIFSRTYL